jgi:hypothetical protein
MGAMGIFSGGRSVNEKTLQRSYPEVVELVQLFSWDMLNHHFEPKVAIPIPPTLNLILKSNMKSKRGCSA